MLTITKKQEEDFKKMLKSNGNIEENAIAYIFHYTPSLHKSFPSLSGLTKEKLILILTGNYKVYEETNKGKFYEELNRFHVDTRGKILAFLTSLDLTFDDIFKVMDNKKESVK